jgi:hypothetical protein
VHTQSPPGTSLNPFRQVLEFLKTPSKTPQTPKASIELRDLRLDLSPPKIPRDTTGMSSKSDDQRMVRVPDTHFAETGIIVWHLEQWLRDTIKFQTDHPETFLLAADTGKALDVVQIITNIKKLYGEIKVGNPLKRLRPSPLQGDDQDIICCLDYMRHFVNRTKHVRFEGFVYATDLSSVFETVALVRSMLFLVHGGEKLFTASAEHSIPRLPKIERYYVSRLFYAAKNAASALSNQDRLLLQIRRSLALKYSTIIDWNRRVPASGLTLDLLPSARWINCTNLIRDELNNIPICGSTQCDVCCISNSGCGLGRPSFH